MLDEKKKRKQKKFGILLGVLIIYTLLDSLTFCLVYTISTLVMTMVEHCYI